MFSWFCQLELQELSAGLTRRQKRWASAIGAVSTDSGGLSTGMGTLNYYFHCGHRPALTSSPGHLWLITGWFSVFYVNNMTSGFALGPRMDYIFFEIAAFIVFQQLFRMICRTGSYTMNASTLCRRKNTSRCGILFYFAKFLVICRTKVIFLLNFGSLKPFWSCCVSPPTQFQRAKLVSTASKIIGHKMPYSSNTTQPCNRLPWLMSLNLKRGEKKTGRE